MKGISMKFSITPVDEFLLVEVAGAVDHNAAGKFYDALVETVGDRSTKLILDLSGVHLLTRAAARGLIVAARLLKSGSGEMRICGAAPPVETGLKSLGFDHLLKFDRSRNASMAALKRVMGRPIPALAAGAPATRSGTKRPPKKSFDPCNPIAAILSETGGPLGARLRVALARVLIEDGMFSMDRIAEICGYPGAETMRRDFICHLGVPPGDYAALCSARAASAAS
jgi:anti-anti-sigma factor